jgi:acyl-CoA dehydrogenase
MPIYKAPVSEALFLLDDVFDVKRYANLAGFADATPDVIEAILDGAAALSEEVMQPLNLPGDKAGCRRADDGSVTTPPGFKQAYKAYADGGWVGLSVEEKYGGQGLPFTLMAMVLEFTTSANMALSMYPGLSRGALAAILRFGSEAQKDLYAPRLVDGTWSATMNLTEPHCGTDLGLMKTKAVAQPDGTYAIAGQKIFISAGEHDLTDNIVHLVLARIEGAPPGNKGISMFIVPKILPEADGSLGARNALSCGALEHKMGIKANATCVMNYDGATGWLIGEANRGLAAMFVMMNEARLGVAIQGLSMSEVAYQNAAAYAKDRKQGRALTAKGEGGPDPIIVHPDIRRNLLQIRAFNEAARALVVWTALQSDIAHRSEDKATVQAADDQVGLLTPIMKGVMTDVGFDNSVLAQQVFGGHGYIEEWGMSQFVRDARIAMIYEGANGIQALDLVGRKLPKDNGRATMAFLTEVDGFIKEHAADAAMAPYVGPLGKGLADLQKATMWFMQNALMKPDNAGAGAYDYMHLFGLVALGYMWARMAKAALAKRGNGSAAAMDTKLTTGRFFMERLLPETRLRLIRIENGAESTMAVPSDLF